MNSIHRPRRRPRVASTCFRSLWWLLRMEAIYRVRYPTALAAAEPELRARVLAERSATARYRAERVLHFNEARRYYP